MQSRLKAEEEQVADLKAQLEGKRAQVALLEEQVWGCYSVAGRPGAGCHLNANQEVHGRLMGSGIFGHPREGLWLF